VNNQAVLRKNLPFIGAPAEIEPARVAAFAVALERFQTDIFYHCHRTNA
jgi:hypothetical protein